MRPIARLRRTIYGVAVVAVLAPAALPAPAAGQALQSRLLRFSAVLDGSKERALRWPIDVAAGPADEAAVADAWENRAVIFRRVGAGWSLAREVALPAPPAAIAYGQGRYFVAVRGESRLYAFASGDSAAAAPQPIALPEGILPRRLAVASDGALWVADGRRGRLVKLRDGAIVAQAGIDPAITALASDGLGGCWAGLGATGEIRRYDGGGQLLATVRMPSEAPIPAWPSGIAGDTSGRLYVLDRHANRIVVLDIGGGLIGVGGGKGWEPGQLRLPGGLARLADGSLVVGDSGNGRAQIFDLAGTGAR